MGASKEHRSMTNHQTPQWRFLTHYLLIAIPSFIVLLLLETLVRTHRLPSVALSDVYGGVFFAIGALALLVALARARRWPLPIGLRTPARLAGQEWRLAVLAGIAFVCGVLAVLPAILGR